MAALLVSKLIGLQDEPVYLILDGAVLKDNPRLLVQRDKAWLQQSNLAGLVAYNLPASRLKIVLRIICKLFDVPVQFTFSYEEAVDWVKQIAPTPDTEQSERTMPQAPQPDAMASQATATLMLKQVRADATQPLKNKAAIPLPDATVQNYIIRLREMYHECEFCRLPDHEGALHVRALYGNTGSFSLATLQELCLMCDACSDRISVLQRDNWSGLKQLFHPRRQVWEQHFVWQQEGLLLHGQTPSGEATITLLALNSETHIQRRHLAKQQGWHPYDQRETSRGVRYFGPDYRLRLDIRNVLTHEIHPLFVDPVHGLTLGRHDPTEHLSVDVNLISFGGYRMGVSRRHMRINPPHQNTITIQDLGSSNGTYLNGQRLRFEERYGLCHGDELKLGDLTIYVYFVHPTT